jgi:hypothetical protein
LDGLLQNCCVGNLRWPALQNKSGSIDDGSGSTLFGLHDWTLIHNL